MPIEDGQLLARIQRGDEQAMAVLYDRYSRVVYSVALRYAGDAAIAQDITQETFLKLYSTIGSFRAESTFESWLYRLVVNCCFDHKRKARRVVPIVNELLSVLRAPDPSILDEVLRSEMSEQLQSVVGSLAPAQRMVIVLRYTQGLSYDEIAGILGCSSGTIGSRLNRVHKVIARRLSLLAGRKHG